MQCVCFFLTRWPPVVSTMRSLLLMSLLTIRLRCVFGHSCLRACLQNDFYSTLLNVWPLYNRFGLKAEAFIAGFYDAYLNTQSKAYKNMHFCFAFAADQSKSARGLIRVFVGGRSMKIQFYEANLRSCVPCRIRTDATLTLPIWTKTNSEGL